MEVLLSKSENSAESKAARIKVQKYDFDWMAALVVWLSK